MISFQSYIGSAYASHPVRWVETPESARAAYAADQASGKAVEKTVDPDLGKPRNESGDVLDISPETQRVAELNRPNTRNSSDDTKTNSEAKTGQTENLVTVGGESPSKMAATEKLTQELTPEEQQKVAQLKVRDQEIRTHEMAHVMAGGQYVTSGPSYEYEVGPDGKGYAVAGSVGIDTSPVSGDPEATISKMQTVIAAAMAPASPSGQDHKVAAAARQKESEARLELSKMHLEEQAAQKEQPEEYQEVAAFSIVRAADKMAESPTKTDSPENIVMPSLVQTQTKSGADAAASSAYKALSTMTLATPRFSAFA